MLIDILSTNLEPVKSWQVQKTLVGALILGGTAAFCAMLTTVGLRSEVTGGFHLGFLALKLVFVLSLISAGSVLLVRLARPGQGGGKLFASVLVPFFAVGLAGFIALRQSAVWSRMMGQGQWAICLFCIPLFAAIPFVVLIWALRKGAPTDLMHTGAIAGLVAGALGAAAYAFHCPDDFLPFIAAWYSAAIAFCTLVGAILGPRLLRW
jgi:hypothetical protein